ncbi:TetR family transcriptional regulator [Paenibacillus sp. GSMTC-2017]|uniref:TetR/AcrR family transcriptional regulator n=1 Tax=Paenibacillus sp. GSMTC-2017 TaxID=2794350 RepID=UPI0018D5C853|nr:TetR/AcrR family transcriptional regulator [Paenibacillus sp. GSMTC-2017]MBH5316382.1 TetR family transcriptional regulator [Paenibacillus sp. GSMTC-2017]
MARYKEEQLHALRDERREQIMNAGFKVFARRGLLGTKMSMVAEEAGVSKGLLYLYFSSKEELFINLIREAMEGAIAAMMELEEMSGSATDKIRVFTDATFNESDRNYFRLVHHAYTSDEVPEEAKKMLTGQYSLSAFVDRLEPIFAEGQRTGELVGGDTRKLVAAFLTSIHGLMLIDLDEGSQYLLPDTDTLMRMVTKRT